MNPVKENKQREVSFLKSIAKAGILIFAMLTATNSFAQSIQPSAVQQKEHQATAMQQATIPVKGMSCNSCVAGIKKKLKPIDGLKVEEVSLANRNTTFSYDPLKVTPQQVREAINELGYETGEPVLKKKE